MPSLPTPLSPRSSASPLFWRSRSHVLPLALFISLGRLIGTYNQFLLYPAIKSVTFVSAYALAFLRNCKHALLHPSSLPIPPTHHQRLTMLSFGIFYTLLPRYDLYTHTPSLLFLLFLKAKYGPVMLSHPSTHPSPPDNWRHEALYTFIPLSPTFFSPPPPP